MEKVYKTCNNCLPDNWSPSLMTDRKKVKYCRCCHMNTVWGLADGEFVKEWLAKKSATRSLIEQLMEE